MLRRVHLHGPYAAFHDGPIEIYAESVWDAVEAVTSQLKGFKPDPINGRKKIQVVGFDTVEKLKAASPETTDIHLMPPLVFGKDGGLIQVLVGIALIVVSFGQAAWLGGAFFGSSMTWGGALFMVGATMALGGLVQMLMPQPKLSVDNADQERSKYLPLTQNTTAIGTPIPILYGRRRIGGHLLSLNIDAKRVQP